MQTELMENLADIVMGTVQYNEEWAGLSINKICDVMTNKSEAYEEEMDAYKRLVQLAQVWRAQTLTHQVQQPAYTQLTLVMQIFNH